MRIRGNAFNITIGGVRVTPSPAITELPNNITEPDIARLREEIAAQYKGPYHVNFTHSKTAFRYPPESLIKKLKRILGFKPKGNPFVKLEDK